MQQFPVSTVHISVFLKSELPACVMSYNISQPYKDKKILKNPLGHLLLDQNRTKEKTDTPGAHFWPPAKSVIPATSSPVEPNASMPPPQEPHPRVFSCVCLTLFSGILKKDMKSESESELMVVGCFTLDTVLKGV